MAQISEISEHSIFDTHCQTIVNAVNCVGVMGKGIALKFKKRFPAMYAEYVEVCKQGALQPGTLWLYTASSPWVLSFPTKQHWRQPAKIEYIEGGLQQFAETYHGLGIASIAFPQIGAGAGGLDWAEVRALMDRYLLPLADLEVEIYYFSG